MSEQWYCHECGMQDKTHHWDLVNRQFCNVCDSPVYKDVPEFVTAIQARISELEAIIEMLPHGDECLLVFNTITDRWEIETCNCPKSKIGSK